VPSSHLAYTNDKVDKLNKVDTLDTLDKPKKVNSLDRVGTVDKLDEVDKVDQVHPLDKVHTLDAVDKVDKLNKVNSLDSVGTVDTLDKVDKVFPRVHVVALSPNAVAEHHSPLIEALKTGQGQGRISTLEACALFLREAGHTSGKLRYVPYFY